MSRGRGRSLKSEWAVSPVIGVMLMLVVTILLATAVSALTGGLKVQKPTPTAEFEVKVVRCKDFNSSMYNISCTDLLAYMQIVEVSGDKIPTKDLEIITYNPNAYGTHKTMVVKPNSGNTHYLANFAMYGYGKSWENGTSPYYNNVALGSFGNSPKVDFGNYTCVPGITMTADWYENYYQGKWNPSTGWYNLPNDTNANNVTGFCACIADGWNITPGQYIYVKIIYIPTHTIIWQKKVLVEGEGV